MKKIYKKIAAGIVTLAIAGIAVYSMKWPGRRSDSFPLPETERVLKHGEMAGVVERNKDLFVEEGKEGAEMGELEAKLPELEYRIVSLCESGFIYKNNRDGKTYLFMVNKELEKMRSLEYKGKVCPGKK